MYILRREYLYHSNILIPLCGGAIYVWTSSLCSITILRSCMYLYALVAQLCCLLTGSFLEMLEWTSVCFFVITLLLYSFSRVFHSYRVKTFAILGI